MDLSVTVEKNELVVRIPLQKPTPSQSGKTLVVASTRGNKQTDATIDGAPITIGLNAYIKAEDRKASKAKGA